MPTDDPCQLLVSVPVYGGGWMEKSNDAEEFPHPIYDDTNVHIEASELFMHRGSLDTTQGAFRFISLRPGPLCRLGGNDMAVFLSRFCFFVTLNRMTQSWGDAQLCLYSPSIGDFGASRPTG